jgi:hypothetical protein
MAWASTAVLSWPRPRRANTSPARASMAALGSLRFAARDPARRVAPGRARSPKWRRGPLRARTSWAHPWSARCPCLHPRHPWVLARYRPGLASPQARSRRQAARSSLHLLLGIPLEARACRTAGLSWGLPGHMTPRVSGRSRFGRCHRSAGNGPDVSAPWAARDPRDLSGIGGDGGRGRPCFSTPSAHSPPLWQRVGGGYRLVSGWVSGPQAGVAAWPAAFSPRALGSSS